MTWNPLRITKWQYKLLYVVVAVVVSGLLFRLVTLAIPLGTASNVFSTALDLAAYLLGARVFRGADELVVPGRAWWRMTSHPKLSRRLGIMFIVLFLVGVAASVQILTGWRVPRHTRELRSDIVLAIEFAILAFLYLNSAVRLTRSKATAQ